MVQDRLAAMLEAWRRDVDAAPFPELVDVDTAVEEIRKAARRRARTRHLRLARKLPDVRRPDPGTSAVTPDP